MLNLGSISVYGVIGGDDVSVDTGGASGVFATKNVGNAVPVTGTGFVLTGADATNYVVDQPAGLAANITPASLVVSGLVANDKVYDGTNVAVVNTDGLIATGLIPGDEIEPVTGPGAQVTFASKDAGTDIPVTISGVSLGGADAGNYELTFAETLTADITPRPLTFNVTGFPTKTYDGTANVFVSQSDFAIENLVPGEGITITQASGINYASQNVGIWDITANLSPSDYQAQPGTLLSNYILPTSQAGQGEIVPAPLYISIIGNPTKPYDGNANATLGPANFDVTGFIVGENATVTQTQGQYSSADAGVWMVTATLDESNFAPDPGTLMSNYFIPSPVMGPGTITRIDVLPGDIFVDITGNPTKVYDGNIIATLSPSDYTLTGFIPGEGAIVTETMGLYASPNAGQRAVFVELEPSDFTPDPGTNLDNYNLPTSATGIGTILKAPLTATIIDNPTRIYNATTRIRIDPPFVEIGGLVAGETMTIIPGNIADYDSPNAGSRIITANLPSPANFIAGPGTLLTNYELPLQAIGPGTILPAPLTILGVTAENKVYDQNTVAQLMGTATLFGVVSGDDVTLDPSASTGTFASPNVGTGIAVTAAGYTIAGADISNYQLFQPSGLSANITRRGLTIADISALDKFYDATTAATLSGGTLTGVLTGDDVTLDSAGSTASFLQANVGTNIRVNVGGFALAGAQAGNYSLTQPSGLIADILPVSLAGSIIGNPTKIYDGTAQVSLTTANYSLTGFVGSEGGAITQSAGAAYDSPNAGARTINATLVVSDFRADPGTLLSNYILPTVISGPGTINQAALIARIINNPTKVYDSTTAATLTSSNFALDGFVAGDGATVTQTAGVYDTKNAGSRIVTATLGPGDFAPDGGTILGNYVLPASATGAGTITPATVQVIGVIANDKVYDGTTVATLDSTGAGLSGIFAGDVLNVVSTGATGTFATKDVGTDISVTATGYTLAGTDAANYLVLQPTGLLADITQASIVLTSVTKVYDATTAAPTVDSAYTLAPVFGTDDVRVDASGITGNYDNKNVGTGKLVTLAGVTLAGADAGNYLISPTTTDAPIGTITPASLNVIGALALDKIYDQSAVAQLDNSGAGLSGVLGGDDVTLVTGGSTGTFVNAGGNPDPNAGVNKPVTTAGYAVTGADAGNYTVIQPTGLTATIFPREITLTSVVKVYDGTMVLPSDAGAYGFTGVLSGDTVVANVTFVTGAYADRNVGGSISGGVVTDGIGITLAGLTLAGPSGSNYTVDPDLSGSPIGVITPRPLAASIVGTPTKTYDALNTAVLGPGNFQIDGFVLDEGATVTQTAGIYDSINAGPRTVTATLGAGDFAPAGTTLLSNYILPTGASGAGLINQAVLTISGVVALDKIYDGTTVAQLNSSAAVLNGIVPAEPLTITLNTSGATGQFAQANVGTDIPVTASGYAIDGDINSNYILTQPTGLFADITQALLELTRVTRVYTGGLELPADNAAYTLSGVVSGDQVFVDAAAITSGGYAAKDVGTGIAVDIAGLSLTGAGAGNYSIASSLTAAPIGEITPAQLTAAIIGNPTKTYDGDVIAILTSSNFELTGFVTGEGASVTQTAGTYDSPNAGLRTVTASLASGDFAPDMGTLLSNYILPTSASGAGTIDPRLLTAEIAGNPAKTYDGTDIATLTPPNFALTGLVGSESITVTQTAGTYDSPNAGSRTVTAALDTGDFTAGMGTLLANYVLPTSASGVGTINRANLAAAIIGNPTKTFDGNDLATLAPENYELTGFVSGEGATVTQTVGTYDNANAGPRTVTASLAAGDFSANSGTLLDNYNLPTSATGAGTIDPKALLAVIAGNPAKTYDGNTVATLNAANFELSGFVGSDDATVTQTAGTYDSANAGPRTVTASLAAGDFAAIGGTNLSNYVLPTSASGAGTIDPAVLLASIINNPTKTYDGTTAATLAPSNFELTGFIMGESATVTQTMGAYDNKDAGARTVTATLASGDFAAGSGTLLSNYVLPTSATGAGTILQAPLNIVVTGLPTKTYDGTDIATLTSGNYQLTGFVAGEGATVTQTTGTYASPNAGIHQITVALTAGDYLADSGTLLANYILPIEAIGPGIITQRALTATIIGNPTKTYDGTDIATLTSGNYDLAGFIAGESGTVTQTAGLYDSPNAGPRTVTAALGSADFVAGPGTLLTNYALPTSATGPGTIDPAVLLASIVGNPTKTYDGTTAALLTSANFQLTGFIGSEGATVTQTAGTYDAPDAGARTVTAALAARDFAADAGTLLSNYVLPASASGAGTIDPATLIAMLTGVTKVYDGNATALLAPPNFQLIGIAEGDSITVTQTAGTFASANAGLHPVLGLLGSGDFTANGATNLGNYVLPTQAAGIGEITPAQLMAVIVGNPTKTYDGTNIATLTSANYELTGFVTGEGATVTQTAGTYDSANAGSRTVTASLAAGDFAATGSTLLSNYLLPASAGGTGTIDPVLLLASIINNPTKTYDGTTAATLAPSNFALTGFIAGESATVTQTVGSYDDRNAGARTVTAALGTGDFAAGSGTLLSNYILPTTATGAGTIDRATLIATIIGNPTKIYDGTTDATLTPENYQITGFVPGEGAMITETRGAYDLPIPGPRTVTAELEPDDFAAGPGTLFSNYILPESASGPGLIISPELPDSIARTVGNPRFYVPYPVTDPIYLGRTNAFAGLPAIVETPSMTTVNGTIGFETGAPIVNSTEQILLQGHRNKQWQLRIELPETVRFEAQP